MLMVIPRWHVTVTLSNGEKHQVWIADTFLENALRKVADMAFSSDYLVRVVAVTVEA